MVKYGFCSNFSDSSLSEDFPLLGESPLDKCSLGSGYCCCPDPPLASSTDNRQHKAVMASGANTLRIEYKVFMAVLFVSFIVVCNIITSQENIVGRPSRNWRISPVYP